MAIERFGGIEVRCFGILCGERENQTGSMAER